MLRNEIYRVIDANINRASEALRVLEECARFIKNNLQSTEKIKNIRHEINNIFLALPNLVASRESVLDVGKDIESSSRRSTVRDVISANCKRASEALRVLSEYGQLVGISIRKLEECRYDIYSLEKEFLMYEKLLRLNNACLYLVAGRDAAVGNLYTDNEFLSIIEKSISGGVDIIQLREKNEKEGKILKLAQEIKKLTKNTEVIFIINDRVDIALAAGADGVHLGQDDLPVSEARKITPPGFIIGLSTHNIEQGEKAVGAFHETPLADYLGVGPVFATPTKPNYKVAGLEYVKWASDNVKEIPFFAIGGIDEVNIDKVMAVCGKSGKRIAVVRAIMNSKDPLTTTKLLKEKLLQNQKPYAQIR